ncbi:DUF4188 domain-containing protein [Auraticoccus sp. F435]|uniref:DUF4188 domain-containing protein n=1 Tax=Auraticoccus cholistanensis TaxID=2656650 RepID=A0A6A9UV43_9ACTN|nr:DUF4188 domain-containing protein [Auraticoccus cholistanensis]MVA76548.1 DUF4188 domain-containing protein [Auraticoccus cholistanensis]
MSTRTTHEHDGTLAVFLIGMRFNRPWRPDAWLPTFLAMPRMLRELARDPGSGFLGYRLLLGGRGVTVVQYWRDVESVYAYAGDPARSHRPAWQAFNRRARRAGPAVGIWHETFQVARAESVYVDMPPTGLAAATRVVEVGAGRHTARERMG